MENYNEFSEQEKETSEEKFSRNCEYNSNIPGPTKYDKAVNGEKFYGGSTSEAEDENKNKSNKGADMKSGDIVAFVLSIASIGFLVFMPILGIILSVICAICGIVLGWPLKIRKSRMGKAGFIISLVSLALSIIVLILLSVFGSAIINAIVYFINQGSGYNSFGFGSPFYMLP